MKKQKICIIGGGLTGLITSIALSKINLKLNLCLNISELLTIKWLIQKQE